MIVRWFHAGATVSGKWRIPPVYKDVLIHEDFIIAHDASFRFGHTKSRFVFFDAQGNQIGERTHKSISPGGAAEGLLALEENGKWGYIDRTGKFVIPPRFDMAFRFAHGEAKVIDAGVFSYVDKSGKVIMRAPAGVDSMSPYNSDGVAIVIQDEPDADQLASARARGLLGLYQGVPRTTYGADGIPLASKITLFRGPHLRAYPGHAALVEGVRETLDHEVAHHLGISDARLRELKARGSP